MKCAVAIVLAIIGMAMAHPAPIGISLAHTPLVIPSAVSISSSIINHGVTIPRLVLTPVIPIHTAPVIKSSIIPTWGLGHSWH